MSTDIHRSADGTGAIIRNALVITMDGVGTVLPRADILIDADGRIAAVGHQLHAPASWSVIDATDKIVLPGFIDTHRHMWLAPLRALFADLTVTGYRELSKSVIAPRVRPEDVAAATTASAVDAIDSGITTVVDVAHIMKTPEYAQASVDALTASGIRAVFAHSAPVGVDDRAWWTASRLKHPEDIRRLATLLPSPGGLVRLGMGIRASVFAVDEVVHADVKLARELGAFMVVDGLGAAHGAAGRWAHASHDSVERLWRAGLLGPDMSVVHGNHLPSDHLRMLADAGVSLSVAGAVEALCGYGIPAYARARDVDLLTTLSTDNVSHGGGDLFGVMRGVLIACRAAAASSVYTGASANPLPDRWAVTTGQLLRSATADAATSLGMGGTIGSLEPGKYADIVVLNGGAINLQPLTAPAASIVLNAHGGNVETVLVGGRVVKSCGVVSGAPGAVAALQRSADFLLEGISAAAFAPTSDSLYRW